MALAKVNGVFRLSKEVELKYLPSGSALAKLSLVNSSKFKTQSGETKEETCFIDGSVFGKLAEVANQYLQKGSKIWIDADLKQESWTAQDGSNKTRHTLKINSFEMLDSKKDGQAQPKQEPPVTYNGQENYVPEVDIDEESIPF